MLKTLLAILTTSLLASCSAASIADATNNLINNATNPSPQPTASASTSTASSKPSPSASASPASNASAADFAGFKAKFEQQATTPRGAARMLFEALINGLADPPNAEAYLTLVLRSDELSPSASSPTGYVLGATGKFMLQQLQAKPQIVYSYVGATPEQNYQNWSRTALQLSVPEQGNVAGQIVVDNTVEKDGATTGKLYVRSSGKDTPTPINMDRNNQGLWKIQTSSLGNLATGVKAATGSSGDF